MKKYIAVDLGASNGRVIVGSLDGIEVMHRFITFNNMTDVGLCWDVPAIFEEIKTGLKAAFAKYPDSIESIGIDTWGVDYVLIGKDSKPVSPVWHYRDSRTDGLIEKLSALFGGKEKIYAETGIAFQPFNTLFQLYAHKRDCPEEYAKAVRYLSLPDYLAYLLCGECANERTHVSTTQLYNPETKDWSWKIIDEFALNRNLFGKIVDSGTVVGTLKKELAEELGAKNEVKVIATAAHDTASAVSAVPSESTDSLYISSGTWSLLGVEIDKPDCSRAALDAGFTNEISSVGKVRFLENIMGMWIQQECVRYWQKAENCKIEWKALDAETIKAAESFHSYIDPVDKRFYAPNADNDLMVDRIKAYCTETGQPVPAIKGEYMVAIYRGLAKAYAKAIGELEKLLGKKFEALYIIGGGSKNEILDQWTADETGLTVYAGPVEATAIGNILMQAISAGEFSSLKDGRKQIKKAFAVKTFKPSK